jgi:hypothetical protein
MSRTFLHCPSLSCTVLHRPTLSCTVLHCSALSCTVLHFPALSCIVLKISYAVLPCPSLSCCVPHCSTLFCGVVKCLFVPCIVLPFSCSVMHCTSVSCTDLHCPARSCSSLHAPVPKYAQITHTNLQHVQGMRGMWILNTRRSEYLNTLMCLDSSTDSTSVHSRKLPWRIYRGFKQVHYCRWSAFSSAFLRLAYIFLFLSMTDLWQIVGHDESWTINQVHCVDDFRHLYLSLPRHIWLHQISQKYR